MDLETILRVLAPRGYLVNEDTILRHVRLAPYTEGRGPIFDFVTWDTNRHTRGKYEIGYALFSSESENPIIHSDDIGVSPLHAIDSDEATRAALGIATLRPGDTDREYFENYTEDQLAFASAHAETLSLFAMEEDPMEWEDLLEH